MIEKDEQIVEPTSDSSTSTPLDLNTAIDNSLLVLPLEEAEQQLIAKIIEAPTKEDLQHQFDLFNMNQSKKNALRIIKLNNLLSKVEDQAIQRFEKRPDQASHKDLLEYMNVVSAQIDRAHKQIESINETPMIHTIAQKNEININMGGSELDRDSNERVMDAISALLKQVQQATSESTKPTESEDIIEATVTEINSDENIAEEKSDEVVNQTSNMGE